MVQRYPAPAVSRLVLEPFADEHLEEAGRLLAARQTAHRTVEPLLPPRYEDPKEARDQVQALWTAEGSSGVVAVRDGRVVGYLIADRRDDGVWGRNAWVELAGHAVEAPEDVRDLYAFAATDWVADGRNMHYAIVPASDRELVDAWFRVGFGQQHALAIRELAAEGGGAQEIRQAEPRDVQELLELVPLLADHQALSPVFSRGPAYSLEEARADIEEDIASPTIGSLVAESDGRIVGSFVVAPVELSSAHSGLARPEGAALLAWAATRPDVRGSGAGLALTQAAFGWARAHGHRVMVTDWRVTNLRSSRFWPRRGFRPTFLRLHRAVVPA